VLTIMDESLSHVADLAKTNSKSRISTLKGFARTRYVTFSFIFSFKFLTFTSILMSCVSDTAPCKVKQHIREMNTLQKILVVKDRRLQKIQI
jgi:uncharacterized membrane protein